MKISLFYLRNNPALSQPDGICICVALATAWRNILHHKSFFFFCPVHFQHFTASSPCLQHSQHEMHIIFVAGWILFWTSRIQLAKFRVKWLYCWPYNHTPASKTAGLTCFKHPWCICESSVLDHHGTDLCSCLWNTWCTTSDVPHGYVHTWWNNHVNSLLVVKMVFAL